MLPDPKSPPQGRVLIVAGSDPTGAAGLQADVKTVTALGGYACAALTAVTVQTGARVTRVEALPPDLVRAQIEAALSDIGADAVKIGMLANAGIVAAVADALEPVAPRMPVVLDPVLAATSGGGLLDADALDILRKRLFPLVAVLTPNLPEAARLTGLSVETMTDRTAAGQALRAFGSTAVLVKGGHGTEDRVTDLLVTEDESIPFESTRLPGRDTRGTGCALASGIAAGLAEGLSLREAVARARAYVRGAIEAAPGFGNRRGPLGHAFPCGFLKT